MRKLLGVLLLMTALGTGGSLMARASPPVAQGKQVFDHWCAACHADSIRAPGTTSLAVKYGKDLPAALEQRDDLAPELVTYFVRHGVSIMPSFRKTEISDAELAALADYLARPGKRLTK